MFNHFAIFVLSVRQSQNEQSINNGSNMDTEYLNMRNDDDIILNDASKNLNRLRSAKYDAAQYIYEINQQFNIRNFTIYINYNNKLSKIAKDWNEDFIFNNNIIIPLNSWYNILQEQKNKIVQDIKILDEHYASRMQFISTLVSNNDCLLNDLDVNFDGLQNIMDTYMDFINDANKMSNIFHKMGIDKIKDNFYLGELLNLETKLLFNLRFNNDKTKIVINWDITRECIRIDKNAIHY